MDILFRDVIYAVRILRRHPASTLTAILTLALGIGLNTAVFSVVSGVLWRNLPFPFAASFDASIRTIYSAASSSCRLVSIANWRHGCSSCVPSACSLC